MKKDMLIGFMVGILATAMGFYFYVEYALSGTFKDALAVMKAKSLYGMVLSISAIPNLIAFFIFLKKKQDMKARGVLLATLLIAILILITQFL